MTYRFTYTLFYTKIRNQTTTLLVLLSAKPILFYTKIRNQTTTMNANLAPLPLLFYTKIRNQTTTHKDAQMLTEHTLRNGKD